jgi:hypothetical protein
VSFVSLSKISAFMRWPPRGGRDLDPGSGVAALSKISAVSLIRGGRYLDSAFLFRLS